LRNEGAVVDDDDDDDVFNNILFNWIELNELKIFSEEQLSEE